MLGVITVVDLTLELKLMKEDFPPDNKTEIRADVSS